MKKQILTAATAAILVTAIFGASSNVGAQCPGGRCASGACYTTGAGFFGLRRQAYYYQPTTQARRPIATTKTGAAVNPATGRKSAPAKTSAPRPCEAARAYEEPAEEWTPIDADDETPEPTQEELRPVCAGLLSIANAARVNMGLSALVYDASLDAGATNQARICAISGALVHGTGNEILALSPAGPGAAVEIWKQSPKHRAILFNAEFSRAGFSEVVGRDGRRWYCMRFK